MLTFRHEYKHIINYCDYLVVAQRIRRLCQHDMNSNVNGQYFIRSLYFDNIDNKALREKEDGINKREKFRLRYYDFDKQFIRLEKKSKINGLCNKQSTQISKDEVMQLQEGDLSFMRDSNKPLFHELYTKMIQQQLKPKTIVDYTREAYTYPAGNVRITFDSNIRSGLYKTNFFDKDCPTVKTGQSIVLEVKYDNYFPEFIKDAIQLGYRRASAFSKYAACRIYG